LNNINTNVKTTIPKYYPDLYPIEKYTHSDFKFDHEEDIKKYYSSGYDALNRYKDYFSNFYSTTQDLVNGDANSVTYKLPTLKVAQTNLNFSVSDLFNQDTEAHNEKMKNIIQLVSSQVNRIKDFKANKLYLYPLLSPVNNWEENVVLCQLYYYKAQYYHDISTNFIKAKDPTAMIGELSIVSPSTTDVDGRFDKNVLTIVNDDKKLQFSCLDKVNNVTYTYITQK
jgi:hypothetical protein